MSFHLLYKLQPVKVDEEKVVFTFKRAPENDQVTSRPHCLRRDCTEITKRVPP
jgi:hypothetical protein